MEEESFLHVMMDMPDVLTRDDSLTVMRTEDFGAWCRRVRDAHEREVDTMRDETYVDTMSDADLAERGLVRKSKEHVVSHATVEVTPHIDWSRMADELDEFVEIVRGIAGGVE